MSNHIPVLLRETIEALKVYRGGRYIDCTVGGGGHAQAILEKGGQLLGIDADPKAIEIARMKLKPYEEAVLMKGNFSHLADICTSLNLRSVDGILFDLGMSSFQLESSNRGFSFQKDEPLDMRFSPDQTLDAAHIVNIFSEYKLAQIISKYGEERRSKLIARCIVRNRPIETSKHLAMVIEKAVGRSGRIHPATKTFQALRIAVNNELENLGAGLDQAINLLGCGGRLVAISFHSLEDRLTKDTFNRQSKGCLCPPGTPVCICNHKPSLKLVSKKVIKPSSEEIAANPRSRSARMRIAERV